jgi:hypothetical protein
MKQILS